MRQNKAKLLILIATTSISAHAFSDEIKLTKKTSIIFQDRSSESYGFGPGYAKATFKIRNGKEIDILPMERLTNSGGVLFSGPNDVAISPTGRFAVLLIDRIGKLTNPNDRDSEPTQSRQYCPVLNTKTGCVVSNLTGEICGGEWDSNRDLWRVGKRDSVESDTNAMLNEPLPSAKGMLNTFQQAKDMKIKTRLSEIVLENLGIQNVIACDPPNQDNDAAYHLIASQLLTERDKESFDYIMKNITKKKR
jgi:hypothetical protein